MLARRPQGRREGHKSQVVQGPCAPAGGESPFPPLARVGPTTPKPLGAKPRTGPPGAVHGPPVGSSAVRSAERGAAIRRSRVGDFPGETETAGPLTSLPASWSPPSRGLRHAHGPWMPHAHPSRSSSPGLHQTRRAMHAPFGRRAWPMSSHRPDRGLTSGATTRAQGPSSARRPRDASRGP
jgi:hypothetical protein